jgi:hypothetical protein
MTRIAFAKLSSHVYPLPATLVCIIPGTFSTGSIDGLTGMGRDSMEAATSKEA